WRRRCGAIRDYAWESTSPTVGSPTPPLPKPLAWSTRPSSKCSARNTKCGEGGVMAPAPGGKQKTEVRELQNMIGGEFVAPAEGKTEDILNPANGEGIAHAPISTQEDVDRAVKAARKAFESWSVTTPAQRQELMLKLADGFQERADEITDWETKDAGKPRQAMF